MTNEASKMLWAVAAVLLVLWVATWLVFDAGGQVHLLLAMFVIIVAIQLSAMRRAD
jgi:hypothetical protein